MAPGRTRYLVWAGILLAFLAWNQFGTGSDILWCVLTGIILKLVLLFAILILPGYCLLRWLAGRAMDRNQAFLLAMPATIALLGLIFVALFSLHAPSWVHQLIYALAMIAVCALAIGRKIWKDSSELSDACKIGLLFVFLSALISVCFIATGHTNPAAIQGWQDIALRNPSHPMAVDNGIQYYAGITFARHLDAEALSPVWGDWIWKISDRPPLLGTLYAIELLATGAISNPSYWDYEMLGIVLNSLYLLPLYLLLVQLFQDRRLAGWIAVSVILNICVFINTWYTWPKLTGTYFALTTVFYVLSRSNFRRRDALVTGSCWGLVALSHAGAVMSLPCLMLYQGIALCRKIKPFRRVLAIGGLVLIFVAAFIVVQLPWEIYKARNSPDRSVLLKTHYFSNYTAKDLNPDLINKCLTTPLGDWIAAFFRSTTPAEQYRHRLSNLATSLRANGFAELCKAIRSWEWDSYFAAVPKAQFFYQLPAIGPLNIVFGILFLAVFFIRRRVAIFSLPGSRAAFAANMPVILTLLSFAIVSLVFNILVKWSGPINHELPYLELVLIMALTTGLAFSLHPVVRILLMAFIGLQFFHYACFATLAHGYSIFDFFSVAMTTAVIAGLLIPVFPINPRPSRTIISAP